jgi:excisionase family DNA binding protein
MSKEKQGERMCLSMLGEYKEILSFKEVCDILQVSRPTLSRYLRSGLLKGFKVGKKRMWRVKKEDLVEFIENGF